MTSSRALRFFLPFPMLLAMLAVAPAASADVLPPQSCGDGNTNDPSVVGQSCDVAGENADEPGVCVASTCGAGPERDGGLGDAGPSPGYTCYLCEVSDGGTSTTDPGSNGSGKGSGGCSISTFQRDGSVGGAMLAVGLFAFAWGRRKKNAR
ncbi:MAG TPA: hypothetical protein VGL81_18645 [Polyangiaceae bacterium]|jgi:hypothetical protein